MFAEVPLGYENSYCFHLNVMLPCHRFQQTKTHFHCRSQSHTFDITFPFQSLPSDIADMLSCAKDKGHYPSR